MNDETLALDVSEETITLSKQGDVTSVDDLVGGLFAQKYEVLSESGRGGMSVVFRARHVAMDKIVAIKILQLHLAKDEISLKRFKQEAQTASNLNHPGIVGVYDCGEGGNGMPYLVMDYVEGKSLAEIIRGEEGPLNLERFLLLMQQVASALAFAHERNVVHRDLKPSNIMITTVNGKEQAKILDFGIAKIVSQSSEATQNLTQTGEVFGSPLYMSPEQCSGASIDQRSDIYSFGCVMYEALSGKLPHIGNSVVETMNMHLNDMPPPMVAPQISEEYKQKLETLTLRCLAKQPEDRYQNMHELESELRRLGINSKHGLLSALGGAWDLASAKRRAAKRNRFPLVVMALLTVSLLSLLSTVMLTWRVQESDQSIEKLKQSRELMRALNDYQQESAGLLRAVKNYMQTIEFNMPEKTKTETRTKFDRSVKKLDEDADYIEKLVGSDTALRREVPNTRARMNQFNEFVRRRAKEVEDTYKINGGAAVNSVIITLQMTSQMTSEVDYIQRLWKKVDKIEKARVGVLNNTTQWVRSLAYISIVLSGSVVVSLAYYFGKGTPQRLKNLAAQAAVLRKRDGDAAAPPSNNDELTDLDNVLHELASALSEAEEREKVLLQKLREQETTTPEAILKVETSTGKKV